MSFARAVAFLWVASLRNRVRKQLQRLKQPKYLVGAMVGLGYLYVMVGRRFAFRGASAPPEGASVAIQVAMASTAAMTVLAAWAFGANRPSLTFSEGEIQQLLPAPVSRRALLRYKLLRGFVGGSVGVLFATFFMTRAMSGSVGLFLVGSLLSFAVVYLHVTGASFVRTRLATWGWRGTALRWSLLLGVFAAGGWGVYVALEHVPVPEEVRGWRELQAWMTTFLAQPPVAVMTWPARVLVQLPLSPDVGTFVSRLPGPLVLLALHYVWVTSMRVPFEESAVLWGEARARERAVRMEGNRAMGQGGRISVRGSPFGRLAPVGRPAVALFWKNLIAGWRLGGPHSLIGLILFGAAVQGVLTLVSPHYASIVRMTLAPTCGVFAFILCLIGPSMFRNDLRMDLRKLDLLRAMPLRGREVVAAELLAPALMLAVTEGLLILVTVVLGMGLPQRHEWGSGVWLAGGLAALFVLPAVSLMNLFVQNAAVVLFPAWLPADNERLRGIEALGQRLLTLMGTMLVLVVGLLPAGVVALLVGFGLDWALGLHLWALPFAGLAAGGVLVGEVGFGVLGVGRAFDKLDVSSEGPEVTS